MPAQTIQQSLANAFFIRAHAENSFLPSLEHTWGEIEDLGRLSSLIPGEPTSNAIQDDSRYAAETKHNTTPISAIQQR